MTVISGPMDATDHSELFHSSFGGYGGTYPDTYRHQDRNGHRTRGNTAGIEHDSQVLLGCKERQCEDYGISCGEDDADGDLQHDLQGCDDHETADTQCDTIVSRNPLFRDTANSHVAEDNTSGSAHGHHPLRIRDTIPMATNTESLGISDPWRTHRRIADVHVVQNSVNPDDYDHKTLASE